MEVLQGILVALGLFASWHVGWHFSDWVKWLFSIRFSATDTHLVIEANTAKIQKAVDNLTLTPNEVRKKAWEYYEEGQPKELQNYLHLRQSQNHFAEAMSGYRNYCSDCAAGDKQYADNIKYLNLRSCECELQN